MAGLADIFQGLQQGVSTGATTFFDKAKNDQDFQQALLNFAAGATQGPGIGQNGLSVLTSSLANASQGYKKAKADQAAAAASKVFQDAKLENLESDTELKKAKAKNQGKASEKRSTDLVRMAEAVMATNPAITSVDEALVFLQNEKDRTKLIQELLPNYAFMYGDEGLGKVQDVLAQLAALKGQPVAAGAVEADPQITGKDLITGIESGAQKAEGVISKGIDKAKGLISGLFSPDTVEGAKTALAGAQADRRAEAKGFLKNWLVQQGFPNMDPTDEQIDAYLANQNR